MYAKKARRGIRVSVKRYIFAFYKDALTRMKLILLTIPQLYIEEHQILTALYEE